MLCWQTSDHTDIFINQRIEFYLYNAISLQFLTPHIMPCYTHTMAIVSWPQILHPMLMYAGCLTVHRVSNVGG